MKRIIAHFFFAFDLFCSLIIDFLYNLTARAFQCIGNAGKSLRSKANLFGRSMLTLHSHSGYSPSDVLVGSCDCLNISRNDISLRLSTGSIVLAVLDVAVVDVGVEDDFLAAFDANERT